MSAETELALTVCRTAYPGGLYLRMEEGRAGVGPIRNVKKCSAKPLKRDFKHLASIYPQKRSALIPMLLLAQQEHGYVKAETIQYLYVIVQMYMREPTEEFADLRTPFSLNLALAVALIGTIYLGILPTRILDWTSIAALSAIR